MIEIVDNKVFPHLILCTSFPAQGLWTILFIALHNSTSGSVLRQGAEPRDIVNGGSLSI